LLFRNRAVYEIMWKFFFCVSTATIVTRTRQCYVTLTWFSCVIFVVVRVLIAYSPN
jgi:hypothetical protein